MHSISGGKRPRQSPKKNRQQVFVSALLSAKRRHSGRKWTPQTRRKGNENIELHWCKSVVIELNMDFNAIILVCLVGCLCISSHRQELIHIQEHLKLQNDSLRSHRRECGSHRFYDHVCPNVIGERSDLVCLFSAQRFSLDKLKIELETFGSVKHIAAELKSFTRNILIFIFVKTIFRFWMHHK